MAKTANRKSAREAMGGAGGNLTDEMIQEDYARFVKLKRDEEKALEEYNSAKGVTRTFLKSHKARGGSTKMLVERYVESKVSTDERRIEEALRQRYREALNMGLDLVDMAEHIGPAAALTNGSDDAEHARLDKIEDEGYFAAKDSQTRDSHSYPPESDEAHAFAKGWDRYALEFAGGNGGKPPKAASRRRGNAAAAAHAH